MKGERCIGRIKKFLEEMGRPCNTIEIYDYLNRTTKYGILAKSLGNILNKHPKDFVRVGSDARGAVGSGNYYVGLWDLSENIYNNSGV